jgi:hypothetical protein
VQQRAPGSDALHHAGFAVFGDRRCELGSTGWRLHGALVLVTNRKVAGVIVDDCAVNWCYGYPTCGRLWMT